jgi:hypothetical protein
VWRRLSAFSKIDLGAPDFWVLIAHSTPAGMHHRETLKKVTRLYSGKFLVAHAEGETLVDGFLERTNAP